MFHDLDNHEALEVVLWLQDLACSSSKLDKKLREHDETVTVTSNGANNVVLEISQRLLLISSSRKTNLQALLR